MGIGIVELLTALVTILGPPAVQVWADKKARQPQRQMDALQKEIADAAVNGTPLDRSVLLERVLDRAKNRNAGAGR